MSGASVCSCDCPEDGGCCLFAGTGAVFCEESDLSLRGGGVVGLLATAGLSPDPDTSSMVVGETGVIFSFFFGSGVRLLTLVGGGGFGPRGLVLGAALTGGWPVAAPLLLSEAELEACGRLAAVACGVSVPDMRVFFDVGGVFLAGGGGRGMFGGGGIIRLTGLLTFCTFVLALGWAEGAPLDGGTLFFVCVGVPAAASLPTLSVLTFFAATLEGEALPGCLA